MRSCIFGGAGFIGSHLAASLAGLGREVTVIGRSPWPTRILPAQARYRQCPQSGAGDLARLLEGFDELVDLAYATVPKTSFTDPVFDIQANLPFAVRLFQAASAAGVGRVVIVSSGGTVYGLARTLPIAETHPTSPLSPYGITKLTIEKYAFMFHHCHGLPVTVVRPANAYGSGQDAHSGQGFVATAMARLAAGEEVRVFGPRGTVRDYVHVDDVVSGIIAALLRGKPGEVYNIGTGMGHDNIEVVEAICRIAGITSADAQLHLLPARPFDVPTNVLDAAKLRRHTGWEPHIDFDRGIERCWKELATRTSTKD
ncbi:NAD-dependent epimerase/dehydratase family protein [Solidesulfovibrio sp.]|uniref:NAD-dependent epimerase/dehydratase family protein n=1 Tax=Solidesulfovibrio sp. TaxID=2910990 RepID=UPI00260BB788|nr:NAD-dependent epimerase/dehydratase family protein [Solidesulfovibrio sp.]